jgi:cytochrome c-type biogenesis protein CcmH
MKKYQWIWIFLFLGALAGGIGTSEVQAQTPFPPISDDQVNAVAKEMYCPVCENIPLDVCPTQACAQWRELIRLKLSEGWTEDQIKEYFALQYGDRVLEEPPRRGLHWLVYILPPLAFVIGLLIVWQVFRTSRKPVDSPAVTDQPLAAGEDSEVMRRIEQDLQHREKES